MPPATRSKAAEAAKKPSRSTRSSRSAKQDDIEVFQPTGPKRKPGRNAATSEDVKHDDKPEKSRSTTKRKGGNRRVKSAPTVDDIDNEKDNNGNAEVAVEGMDATLPCQVSPLVTATSNPGPVQAQSTLTDADEGGTTVDAGSNVEGHTPEASGAPPSALADTTEDSTEDSAAITQTPSTQPLRPKPRPMRKAVTSANNDPPEYDGDLRERATALHLTVTTAAASNTLPIIPKPTVPEELDDRQETEEDNRTDEDEEADTAVSLTAATKTVSVPNSTTSQTPANRRQASEEYNHSDEDELDAPIRRVRASHSRNVVHDSDDDYAPEKESPPRFSAAAKGKHPVRGAISKSKRQQSPMDSELDARPLAKVKPMALFADEDSEDGADQGEDVEDDDGDEDMSTKRGPFPSWALEEAANIRRMYIENIAGLATRAKKSLKATTNLVEGKESPKKEHYWNMYQSWYGVHGEVKKPSNMKVSEYTKTIVKPAYDVFLEAHDGDTTLTEHFKVIREFYESAQKESNKQRQEDGNAASSVNVVAAKFEHLSQWAYLNHECHIMGFVFSLAKDKQGCDLQRIFFGSPQMETLEKNMHSNIQQSLTEIRAALVLANAEIRREALAAAPEDWLNKVDFFPKATGNRDRDRRVLPEILRQLTNRFIENTFDDQGQRGAPLAAFPWANWANVAYRHKLTMINWPSHLSPCPGQVGFNPRGIPSKDLVKLVRRWRNYKDNELGDDEADGLLRIVEWSEEEKHMEREKQDTVALVVDDSDHHQTLITVAETQDYLKAVGKSRKAEAVKTARVEHLHQQKTKQRHQTTAHAVHPPSRPLPPRPGYVEVDAPMADPSKPHGGAVGPNGRLLDASEIDFSEERDMSLPPVPVNRRHRLPSPHRRHSPSPRRHRSPSPRRRHSTSRRHRSPFAHRHRSPVNNDEFGTDNDMAERPTKRARLQAPSRNVYAAQYSPAKPAHKQSRDEEEDLQDGSGVGQLAKRKVKKLPPRAYSRDHDSRRPTSKQSQVPRGRQQGEYYDNEYDYPARNEAGPSKPRDDNHLYRIDEQDFVDDAY